MGAWDMSPAAPARRRLVLVVRADPVICGHSGEARNLAEAALHRGFTEVRIVTWPLDLLASSGLPLKPLDGVRPYFHAWHRDMLRHLDVTEPFYRMNGRA